MTSNTVKIGTSDILIHSATANEYVHLGLGERSDFVTISIVRGGSSITSYTLTNFQSTNAFGLESGDEIHAICPEGNGIVGIVKI